MKKYISLMILCCIYFSLSAQKTQYDLVENIPYYEIKNQAIDSYISERCVLDIYYPKDSKDFPTVVWFHGGGLTGGRKEIPSALKEKGIAVVGVGYRLSPKVTVQQCIEDAAASVSWVFDNIEKYGGNKSLIFVSGHSAGGYLTAMIGLDKSWLNKHQKDANDIAGLIPFSGQMISHFTYRKELQISETQPLVDKFAPLFHVRKDTPPLLLITGDREMEMLGRYEENAYLYRMMKVVGNTSTRLFELDGYGHDMTEPAFPLLLREVERIRKEYKR